MNCSFFFSRSFVLFAIPFMRSSLLFFGVLRFFYCEQESTLGDDDDEDSDFFLWSVLVQRGVSGESRHD
jgi:hypothetical protein